MDKLTRTPAVITIGNFDGMHRGHVKVVATALELARMQECRCAAVTFTASPLSVLRPTMYAGSIITETDKEMLLHEMGIADIVALEPIPDILGQSPTEFLQCLQERYEVRGIVVGENFSFGADAVGGSADLYCFGRIYGVKVIVVPLLRDEENNVISSTHIRHALAAGKMEAVTRWLGRYWRVTGTVLHGDARGRMLGYPTTNLDAPADRVLPPDGVYATWVTYQGERYAAATNIGTNPTFSGRQRRIESHLLDMHADMYGADICVDFAAYIRPQITFADVDALKHQLAIDTSTVRCRLKGI